MSTAAFIKGCRLKIDDIEFALIRKLADGKWQLEAQATGELRCMTQEELLEGIAPGRVRFIIDEQLVRRDGPAFRKANLAKQFDLLPDGLKEIAKRRRHLLTALEKEIGGKWSIKLVRTCIAKVWQQMGETDAPPHPSTVWRWLRRYQASGKDIRSLVTAVHRSGNHKKRLPEAVEAKVREAVDAVYLTTERGTYQDTLDHAIAEISRENRLRLKSDQLPLPGLDYVKRIARETPPFDREVARYGRPAAERRFRCVVGHPVTKSPLCRVEIDHTRIDVFVVDDETFLPLGRPWLTICIDAHTRVILGFHLGFDPPSYSTVARALKHAILPKTYISTLYPSVKGTWDMYGVMDSIVVDNGPEFHSESLEASCYSLGIDIQYCPRKQPWYKGIVERTLGTLNRGVAHGVPGTTFSNILEKAEYDAAKHATITLRTLREMIHVWIVDYYHQRPHKGLRDTPAHAWKVGIEGTSIRLPTDPKDLDVALCKIATRRLTHKGIEINNLYYNSLDARDLMYRLGDDKSLTVRYDDEDLGHIQLLDPDSNEHIEIPALDRDYAKGLTLYQHQVCRRFAQRELHGRTNVASLAEAKRRIQDLVDEDVLRKGKRTRVRGARFRNVGKDDPHAPDSDHQTVAPAGDIQKRTASTPSVSAPPPIVVATAPRVASDLPVRRVQRAAPDAQAKSTNGGASA